jgi:hypothetical protein
LKQNWTQLAELGSQLGAATSIQPPCRPLLPPKPTAKHAPPMASAATGGAVDTACLFIPQQPGPLIATIRKSNVHVSDLLISWVLPTETFETIGSF